ncbi:MAG: cellulose-binding protein [Steroidobacteraceae bacterium]
MTDKHCNPAVRATRWLAVFASLASACLLARPVQAETSSNYQSPIGINLQGVNGYSSEIPFLNVFKMGSGWMTQGNGQWDTKEEQYLSLDSNGYPTSLTAVNEPGSQVFNSVAVLLLNSLPATANGDYPAGQYVVLYDGQGTLSYSFDAKLVSSAPGRDVIDVTPSTSGILVKITSTDPQHTGNYLRNIRVVQAKYESALDAGKVFNPVFLANLQNFRALRFMDWLRTNGSTLSTWANRPLPTDAFWGTNSGVPLEVCIELANAVSADAWLNIPALATDDYITQMAKLVQSELGRTQKAYVEYSNEVWNSVFTQNGYSISEGTSLFPSAPNKYYAGWEWYGMRVAQIGDIWYGIYGSSAFSSRVVIVMAGQAANSAVLQEELSTPDWKGTGKGPAASHHIGAAAIAPYFLGTSDLGSTSVVAALMSTVDSGLAKLFTQVTSPTGSIAERISWTTSNAKVASSFSLPLLAYEGGQSLQGFPTYGNGSPEVAMFIAANRDPRMGAAYTTYLDDWKSSGGTLFMHFNDTYPPSQYGMWGLLESTMQSTQPLSSAPPKWQAVQNFISSNKCWWSNCAGMVEAVPDRPPNFAAHSSN